MDHRALLTDLYRAAVAAADPARSVREAMSGLGASRRSWIIAVGKAALPMARAAAEQLDAACAPLAGGLAIAPEARSVPHMRVDVAVGDHPVPGPRSLAAAGRLDAIVRQVSAGDDVWVLLSGGASSLAAAPVDGVSAEDLSSLFVALLASGVDVSSMNLVRKRFSTFGAGRLAAALAPARVRCLTISDVVGDDLAFIGSGPCVADPATWSDVRRVLGRALPAQCIPPGVRRLVERASSPGDARLPETPKPDHPAFRTTEACVIANNRLALEGAAARARRLGLRTRIVDDRLGGAAAPAGDRIAHVLLDRPDSDEGSGPEVSLWGGETTVTLAGSDVGLGGRCQELALAAARVLHDVRGERHDIALLAAGTDGRDGPTDAAGAIVEADTWDAIRRAGRDPARDLERHDTYRGLDAADALLRTGWTGTNVMDVIIGASGIGPRFAGSPAAHAGPR